MHIKVWRELFPVLFHLKSILPQELPLRAPLLSSVQAETPRVLLLHCQSQVPAAGTHQRPGCMEVHTSVISAAFV